MEFKYRRRINYYETDKMGIVHHSNYIRFLEEARMEWLEKANVSMRKLEENGITIPTLEVNCKYLYHVTSEDLIIIEPYITEYNGVRINVGYNVIDEKTGRKVIEANTKHCFTDKNLRPINMKKRNKEINEIFENLKK